LISVSPSSFFIQLRTGCSSVLISSCREFVFFSLTTSQLLLEYQSQ
jgi:hypothetical protein